MMKTISLLGSTGSIGINTLAVIRQFPERFQVSGLAAGSNVEEMRKQVIEFEPDLISMADESLADELAAALPKSYAGRILSGDQGLEAVATEQSADMTITAVVGAVGLKPTLAAICAGKDIGLANKETLVMAGALVMEEARRCGVRLLPIDSEHNAIFQALEAGRREDVKRIILTASGGPFHGRHGSELDAIRPAEALAHPNWDMGRKISIDSATLMNKGLEVIEARWLFDIDIDAIDVVVHSQSVVHSLVEFIDGSVVAQLGIPDMRIPIAYALSYPERLPLGLSRLCLSEGADLSFEKPDNDNFPALQLAYTACRQSGCSAAVLNAANEVAVAAFLDEKIRFTAITEIVAHCLEQSKSTGHDLNAILLADTAARKLAREAVASGNYHSL